MQVLVVAVQNAVPYEELGTATSGTTFFRMIGGSFGTAVFGAVYANLVVSNVLASLHLSKAPPGFSLNADNPAAIHHLPPPVQTAVIDGIAHTIQTMFLIGVPIGLVAFLLSWTLPEIELRKSIRTSEPAENLGLHEPRTSLGEVRRILERAASRENRRELYEILASRAQLDLDPRGVWMLYRLADRPGCTLEEVGARLKVEPRYLEASIETLVSAGLLRKDGGTDGAGRTGADSTDGAMQSDGATRNGTESTDGAIRNDGTDGCSLVLTSSGHDAVERLTAARRSSMTELLEGWDPEAHPEVLDLVRHLARALMADDDKLLADARAASS
jgi:DNA-binding MarR family transcriptional regulator